MRGAALVQGDAEDLPFPSDTYDRYVSAGSIEYWPEPQRGICEVGRGWTGVLCEGLYDGKSG